MIEKKFEYTLGEEKTIERIISDGNADINHMILPKGDALPEHFSNSNVYMLIVRGILTIRLNDETANKYVRGEIISIPYNIKMNVYNEDSEVLEFFVVKSPSPQNYSR
ncbi:MAG: cupin domain-containing protein [Tissierellales bacterium]|nr:cupin domain-containing protein [Tissierellales bacterium]